MIGPVATALWAVWVDLKGRIQTAHRAVATHKSPVE